VIADMFRVFVCAAAISLAGGAALHAQRGRGDQPPPPPRAAAPVDLTGSWVSVITEDWRYRMVTPPKGDRPGIPLNAEGVRVATAWDPAKDEADGEPCKAYGAVGVMRAPGRIRIAWQDDATLKLETEAGTQTRLLRFAVPDGSQAPSVAIAVPDGSQAPSWQGRSIARWEPAGGGRRGRGPQPQGGSLKVTTTHMRAGYLQKNGVPYGSNAALTEYFSRTTEPNGDSWLIVTAILEDEQYLTQPFVRSTHFKKLPGSSTAWEPEPCSAR
jgi:hypothetical protein